jgi:methyl-accepting chemotaxis protein
MMAMGAVFAWRSMATIEGLMTAAIEQAERMREAQEAHADTDRIYFNLAALVMRDDAAGKRGHQLEIDRARQSYQARLAGLKASAQTDEGRRLIDDIERAIAEARDSNTRAQALSMEGKNAEARVLFSEDGTENRARTDAAFVRFIEFRQSRIAQVRAAAAAGVSRTRWALFLGTSACVVAAILLAALIARSVARPIGRGVGELNQIAKGDLSQDVPADLRARQDEIGDLCRSMQAMTERLRGTISEVGLGVDTLASASTELSTVSSQTGSATRTAGDKSVTVAAAAEESSANTASVASSMELAAQSLTSVAGATEQMSATIGEVAQNAARARSISEQASAQAQAISTMMSELGQAAHEIGKVTETITDISSQTNLLALNATIEAARAGAAGKGFAVVANEIKELARQTANATEDIKAKIAAVQGSTDGAIADIQKITDVVHEVGSLVNAIAAAIEEQAAVTRDVAGNVAQASSGVKEAHDRVEETAVVSRSIARDIAGLNASMQEVQEGSQQVQASATGLSKLAEQLRAIVGQFKTKAA